jgi:hypothetical protein
MKTNIRKEERVARNENDKQDEETREIKPPVRVNRFFF